MHIIYIAVMALMLSACTSMVNVDYNTDTNFNKYKTYKVHAAPVRVTADTRVESPFMQQRVVSELHKVLTSKGFKQLNKNQEIDVQYYLDIKKTFETQDSGFFSFGTGSFSHHSSVGFGFTIPIGEINSVDSLVLTIDLLSTKSGELIWRGSLAYPLYEGATPKFYTALVKDLVNQILNEFPPK